MPNKNILIAAIIGTITCGYLVTNHDNPSLVSNNAGAQQATAINEKLYLQDKNLLPTHTLPASLADIDSGVVLQMDKHGNLIVNSDTLDLFEFYLSAMGEEPLEQILLRIRHHIEKQLTSAAKDQAFSLLKNFVDYKIELSTLSTAPNNLATHEHSQLESLKLQKTQVSSLRAHYFSPSTYQAFFKQEETYDNFMLSQLEIRQNPLLDDAQKKQQLDAIVNDLPQEIKDTRESVSRHAELYQAAQDLRDNGASKEDVYQLRATSLGTDAAMALAELDEKRNHWRQRLNRYAQQRDTILSSGLTDNDRQTAIESLIQQNFSQPESIRVKALNHTL